MFTGLSTQVLTVSSYQEQQGLSCRRTTVDQDLGIFRNLCTPLLRVQDLLERLGQSGDGLPG